MKIDSPQVNLVLVLGHLPRLLADLVMVLARFNCLDSAQGLSVSLSTLQWAPGLTKGHGILGTVQSTRSGYSLHYLASSSSSEGDALMILVIILMVIFIMILFMIHLIIQLMIRLIVIMMIPLMI